MKRNNNFSDSDTMDIFDDNFEVTYDDDNEFESLISETRKRKQYDNLTGLHKQTSSAEYRDRRSCPSNRRTSRSTEIGNRTSRKRPVSERKRRVKLASPIRKGGRVLSRITSSIIRSLTAALILVVSVYVTNTFWKASTPYGDIMESLEKMQFSATLLAYLCPVACFLLFEFISLLWSMTRVRVRDGLNTWREDTGRGLFSFIFVFALSYFCFLFSRFIPDSPEIIYGLKGACDVYGSMHNALLGLCAAGVISCLIRKYF